jgi:[NiFe] hydrogenase large subunit
MLDWVDVVSALSADPAGAVSIDRKINPARTRDASFFTTVKQRLQTFAESGQLGPFANGYWRHPAYILTPEENLVFMADYLEAFRVQAAHMHAILGGKNPHPQTMIVGGVTLNRDLKASRISDKWITGKGTGKGTSDIDGMPPFHFPNYFISIQ